jgi:hypothetical protein
LRSGSKTKWYPAGRAGVLAPERICADRIGAIEKIVGEFAGKR